MTLCLYDKVYVSLGSCFTIAANKSVLLSQTIEIPESRGLFVIVLLADILNTVIREIIIVSNGDPKSSATAAVVMFVLVGILFFGLLAIIHFVYLCVLKHHYTIFITSSIQTVGALLYFYGDNITILLNSYSVELGCGEACVANNRIAASFSLGVALIIFQIVPTVMHKLFDMIRGERSRSTKIPNWYSALDMITVLVKLDTLYSAVVVMVESRDFCSRTDIATSASFISICILIGVGAEVVYCLYAQTTNEDGKKLFACLTTTGLLSVILCFPLYILADNHQPLDCAFGCDRFAANTTMNDLNCRQTVNSSVRLGFTVLTFILVTTFSLIYFICNFRAREEYENEKEHIDHEFELSQFT